MGGSYRVPAAGAAGADPARRFRRLQVRRERRSRRLLLFAILLGVSVLGFTLLTLVASFVLAFFEPLRLVANGRYGLVAPLATLVLALAAAGSWWFVAQLDARQRLMKAMGAQPPDSSDRYHKRLLDIVEELRLASGEHAVACVVVRSTGLNAFAFSDLRGGGVVGVTEGALSRLSRNQLEGVMAHEFAHIVAGSHTTATLACLLFAFFANDEKVVSGGDDSNAGIVYLGRAAATGALAAALTGMMRLGAALVSGALSREREYEADQAAARYTGDPVSLAMALRTIALSPGGYVPPSLAPLCIRAADGEGWLSRAATHPPIESRINALLALANVSPADFEAMARRMDGAAAARQHVERPPLPVSRPAPVAPLSVTGAAAGAARPPALGAGCGGAVGMASPPQPGRPAGAHACPGCGGALAVATYEGTGILICPGCGGRWVSSAGVARVLARRDVAFSDAQRARAREVAARGVELRQAAGRGAQRAPGALRLCPSCGVTMIRRLYSYDYAVDVDYCSRCDAYWFDHDELEVLQVLAEGGCV